MNKFLVGISLVAVLAVSAAGFCADSNQAGAKPEASPQEKALWDKITGLQKGVDEFDRNRRPPFYPGPYANEADIKKFTEAMELFNRDVLKQITPLRDASEEYYNKYPKGFYAKENLELLMILMVRVGYMSGGQMRAEDEIVYNKMCKDENLTVEQAAKLFSVNLSGLQGLVERWGDKEKLDKKAIESLIDKMEAQINEFGQRFKFDSNMIRVLRLFSEEIKDLFPQRSKKILELGQKYANEDGKKTLDGITRGKYVLGSKPQIKFKAVDGSEVDLSKMKGKVVLIDFWATWCGPCMGELPNVLDVYRKYHDKGFEIIGISFDRSIEALQKVTKERGMTWAQYFDGKEWDNDFGAYFGIQGIPTMWLVDKEGKVADTESRGTELGNKVKKLLGIEE
jgi:thiol-disulfide isomerase/thioredoxin